MNTILTKLEGKTLCSIRVSRISNSKPGREGRAYKEVPGVAEGTSREMERDIVQGKEKVSS